MCKPFIASYLRRVSPWTKVVFILRNPVDRAYSAWKMEFNTPKSQIPLFRKQVADEIRRLRRFRWVDVPPLEKFLRQQSNTTSSTRDNGSFSISTHTVPRTLADRQGALIMEDSDGILQRRLQCGMLGRGLYAQQLQTWLQYYTLNENLIVIRYEDFVANRTAVLERLYGFVGASNTTVTIQDEHLEKTYQARKSVHRRKGEMADVMRNYLTELYRPFNEELADLLGEEWRNVWD